MDRVCLHCRALRQLLERSTGGGTHPLSTMCSNCRDIELLPWRPHPNNSNLFKDVLPHQMVRVHPAPETLRRFSSQVEVPLRHDLGQVCP